MPTKTTKRAKPTKNRELVLFNELQDKYGYRIFDMPKEKDKNRYVLNLSSGNGKVMRMIQLALPEKSALAKSLVRNKCK